MIALIALIAVVVVVGGGIEVLRRARFGVGPSAAHHRALDTLGHITNQNVDTGAELVEAAEPTVLSHVRRAVESDPAQPRIEPQPVSQPVAVPAITGGPNFVGTVPSGQALGRGPDTEIEGVRLLVPDPPPSSDQGDEAIDAELHLEGGAADEDAVEDGAIAEAEVAEDELDDVDEGSDELEIVDEGTDELDAYVPAHAAPEVLTEEVPAVDASDLDDGWEGVAGWDEVLDDVSSPPAGEVDGWDTGEQPVTSAPTGEVMAVDEDVSTGDDQAPAPDEGSVPDDADERPAVVRFDDLGGVQDAPGDTVDLRPVHIAAGPSGHSGAIPGLTPDETRAQLAALVESGGMGAAAAGTARRRHRRPQRDHRHHHPVSSALMLVVAVLILGGAVFLVTHSSSSSPGRARPVATGVPATTVPETTTTVSSAASLVSQTASTAVYQVSGSPTIDLDFSSQCWTEVRQGSSSGPLLFEGTQAAGAQKQVTGPVWVRLGNPTAVSVSVGGTTLAEPTVSAGNPFNLQFQ